MLRRYSLILVLQLSLVACDKPGSPPVVRLTPLEWSGYTADIRNVTGPAEVTTSYGELILDTADAHLVELYETVLLRELELYPDHALEDMGIGTIVLAGEIELENDRLWGLADTERGELYLSVDLQVWIDDWKRVIHHELFHFIEDNGMDRTHVNLVDAFDHSDWSSLNPPGFTYVLDRRYHSVPRNRIPFESETGFLTQYQKTRHCPKTGI